MLGGAPTQPMQLLGCRFRASAWLGDNWQAQRTPHMATTRPFSSHAQTNSEVPTPVTGFDGLVQRTTPNMTRSRAKLQAHKPGQLGS